jgi:hypothetical protein
MANSLTIADLDHLGDAGPVRHRFISICVLVVGACTRHVDVSAVRQSRDFSGLSKHEHEEQPSWAAFDVIVPADIARSIRRWQLSNVTLQVFRCGNPNDAYPADARFDGKRLQYEDLREPLPASTRLTFYVPLDTQAHEANVCAALDARGYSPIFLRGQTLHLPPLRMTFPHYDKKTGRITST